MSIGFPFYPRTPEQIAYDRDRERQEAYGYWRDTQGLQLQGYGLDVSMANQAYQNAAQPIYNRNSRAQAGQSAAAATYALGQDMASLALQNVRAAADVKTQAAMNLLSLSQQRASNARYEQGLNQDIIRTRYNQATSQAPGAFNSARRLLGY